MENDADLALAELARFVDAMELGTIDYSADELELANQALASLKAREGEDIEEWARRLTEDADKW